jgi:mono/diheme cytochrome c family protein
MNRTVTAVSVAGALLALSGAVSLGTAAAQGKPSPQAKPAGSDAAVARGRYLVTLGGCNDCHTPLEMGPNGPAPDMKRMLSGHPEQLVMPPAPAMPGPWAIAMAGTATAFAGPWGTTFAPNLTPDPETGLGKWTEKDFVDTVKSGRHLGRGRPILPPMPIQNLQQATDEDLKAIYAYLRSIPPIRNQVPALRPPAETTAAQK